MRALLFIALTACSDVASHGEFVPAAPYTEFHTFSFATAEASPDGYHPSHHTADVLERMKPLIASAMERKGYSASTSGPGDIVISFGAGRREVEEHHRLPPRLADAVGEDFEDHDFREGGIVIDAFDRSNGQIWHGAARAPIAREDPPKHLQEMIDAALARFPARSAR
jgi:hypothetical protein